MLPSNVSFKVIEVPIATRTNSMRQSMFHFGNLALISVSTGFKMFGILLSAASFFGLDRQLPLKFFNLVKFLFARIMLRSAAIRAIE